MINQFWTCLNRLSGRDADTFSAKASWHASSFGLLICGKLLIWPFLFLLTSICICRVKMFHRMLRAGEAASSSSSSTSSTCACSGGPWLPPAPTQDWHWASDLTQDIKWHQTTSNDIWMSAGQWQEKMPDRLGPLQNSFRALVCSASLRIFKHVQICSGKFFVGSWRGRRPISSVGPKNLTIESDGPFYGWLEILNHTVCNYTYIT